MTSRTLIAATLETPVVRRNRKSDGGLFAVAKIIDRDRNETRRWTVFINDQELIEQVEALRIGEPLAITGPFYVVPAANGADTEYRITCQKLLDTRPPRKSKTAKAREARVKSDEWDDAPKESATADFDDPLPF
jgi:hypothetical protein